MSIKISHLAAVLLSAAALSFGACQQANNHSGAGLGNGDIAQDAQTMAGPAANGAMGQAGMGMAPPQGGAMGPPPDESSDLSPTSKVTYKSVEGKDLQLHIFNPEGHNAGDARPALVFYHGGGFRFGNPQAGYDLSERLNPKGVVLIAPDYRLIDRDDRTLDQIMSDAKSSVRYIRANADALGIDPDKIVASGHSAGAYLAAVNGFFDGFDEPGEDTALSAQANAMILWSMGTERAGRNIGEGRTEDDYQPITYLDGDMPPSKFIHGSADTNIAPGPAQAFSEQIAAAGNVSSMHIVEGADHFFRDDSHRNEAITEIISFMDDLGYIQD